MSRHYRSISTPLLPFDSPLLPIVRSMAHSPEEWTRIRAKQLAEDVRKMRMRKYGQRVNRRSH